MSDKLLHHALLRPAIIQILRAQGFSSAKPSVVDTITDMTAKYLMLLATRTLSNAQINHVDSSPDLTDVRMAMVDCGLLQPTETASEEVWKELLRKPLEDIPERNDLRRKEAQKRETEDTEDVQAFTAWYHSGSRKEISRVAGLLLEESQELNEEQGKPEDYLTLLKKKHSKTGEDSRFSGTVLGKEEEARLVKIDGPSGTPESIDEWQRRVRQRSKKLAGTKHISGGVLRSIDMEDAG